MDSVYSSSAFDSAAQNIKKYFYSYQIGSLNLSLITLLIIKLWLMLCNHLKKSLTHMITAMIQKAVYKKTELDIFINHWLHITLPSAPVRMLNPSWETEHFPPITSVIHTVYQTTPLQLLSLSAVLLSDFCLDKYITEIFFFFYTSLLHLLLIFWKWKACKNIFIACRYKTKSEIRRKKDDRGIWRTGRGRTEKVEREPKQINKNQKAPEAQCNRRLSLKGGRWYASLQ